MAVYPAAAVHRVDALLWLGIAAVALLGASLALGWPVGIPWALGILGAEFVASLYAGAGSSVFAAAIYGSALLVMAEISYWSLDLRTRSDDEAGLARRRLLAILTLVAASLGAGAIGIVVARLPVAGSLALTAVGTGAAAAALLLAAALARKIGE